MSTRFPNGIDGVGSRPETFGREIWVDYDNGSNGNDGLSKSRPVKTIAQAYSIARSNKNDVIYLSAYSSHPLTSMLTLSKNRVHFVGLGVANRIYGQGAKITMGVTTAVTDIHMIKNIGVRNSFHNIKFTDNNTLTEHTSTIGEGGEYVLFENCEFYSSVKLTSDTYAEVLLNGDSPQFINCTFGSLADAVTGDKVRPAIITTGGGVASSISGGVTRDALFKGCKFWKNAGGTTTTFIKITNDNDLERMMEIEDCTFLANKLGSVPAVAISSPTLTKSQVLLTGNTIAYNCTKIGTATGIINGTPARVATATIGIQAT